MPQHPYLREYNPAVGTLVCPHCKGVDLAEHAFMNREGTVIRTYWCRRHGDVVPMRSAIFNVITDPVDWSAA